MFVRKTKNKISLGIVLHAVPGYSETFFRNKISFLKEEGFDVKLFVDGGQRGFDFCPVVEGFFMEGTKQQRLVKFLILVTRSILHSVKLAKLCYLNKRDGFTFNQNVLSLIHSVHILGHSLDWLHFGFASIAVNRENLSRVIGAKMAVSVRGFDVCIYPLKHSNVYKLLWNRIDKLHYISDDLYKVALELGLSEKIHSQKITPAIDIDVFKKTCLTHDKSPIGKIFILTVARLHWKKGLDYTLEALKIIKDAGILFEYHIIGDGPEYERLVFARHQLGLQNEVVFWGKLEPKEIKEKLSLTDVYLQYSIQEGFCNAVLEAQAMGCLCIVSDAEGLGENVLDEITGFTVEKRNPKLLSGIILDVLALPTEEKQKMRENAMNRVYKEFNLQIQKQKFIEFYQ
jgi:colanic acid/amylovoran biosynthesis glycosyltransferase